MVTTEIRPEEATMRRRIREWKEPKRKPGEAPTLTARAVANILGYTNTESIQIHVRNGPENNGLPGYIPSPSGEGWIRKNLPNLTDEEKRERQRLLTTLPKKEIERLRREGDEHTKKLLYETHSGTQIMFYKSDVEDWMKHNPVINKPRPHVKYTQEQHDLIIRESEGFKNSDGSVNRSKLFMHLQNKYGIRNWNTRNYNVLKQVLDDEGVPLPPGMKHSTTARRRYRAI